MPADLPTHGRTDNDAAAARQPLIDALQTLLARIDESQAGYGEMIDRADPAITPLLRRWHEVHAPHRPALADLIADLGETPEGGGTLREAMQETVIKVRDAITGLHRESLSAVMRGEDVIRDAYDKAMAEATEPAHLSLLGDQLARLDALRAETEAAAD